jgi:hypothetical protein
MLKLDSAGRQLIPFEDRDLRSEHLLERTDIQEMIASSWDAFAAELGFPSLRLIDTEVRPHDSVANRIDILAFDEEQGAPVIVELKRDRNKLQLLQALSYAAMVWTWDPDRLKSLAGSDADDDLLNSIDNMEGELSPRIILIAEEFDPEVILTADWLSRKHGVDLSCFTLLVQRLGDDRFVRLQLSYPLPELDQIYRARSRGAEPTRSGTSQSWEEVKQWTDEHWVASLIDVLRLVKEGDPRRRRFSSMFANEWGSYSFIIQRRGANIYIGGRRVGDLELWEKALPSAEISTWGSESSQTQGLRIKLKWASSALEFLAAVGQENLAADFANRLEQYSESLDHAGPTGSEA